MLPRLRGSHTKLGVGLFAAIGNVRLAQGLASKRVALGREPGFSLGFDHLFDGVAQHRAGHPLDML